MSVVDQASVPDTQSAFNHLLHNVKNQAFFRKLASFGRVPQTEKQAQYYVALAERLRTVKQHPTVKAAADAADPIALACRDLDAHLERRGFIDKRAGDEQFAAQAAAQLMEDADTFNSVLSLKFAEANDFATRNGLATV